MPDVPPYSGASYDISPQDMGIGALITLGAFSAIGIGAFATGAFVASGAPLVAASYPSVVPGTIFVANSAAHASQIAAAVAAIDASIATGAAMPLGVTDVLTTCAIASGAGAICRALLLAIAAGGGSAAYGQGEHAPAYDGLGGVLAYPSGNPLGDIHNLAAIGINTTAGTVNGVQFFVKFHVEAF